MRLPHWLRGHRGPIVRVEHVYATRAVRDEYVGWWTRPICRCDECGALFVARLQPGRLTIAELNE